MPGFKIALLGLLYFTSLALGTKCPEDAISKLVVCYFEGKTSLTTLNICNCTHVVFTNAVRKIENSSISATEGTLKYLSVMKEKKKNLSTIFTLEIKQNETSMVLKSENRSQQLIKTIADFLQESQFDGIEFDIKFSSDDGIARELFASFVKHLSKTLSSQHPRVKRDGYDVFEKLQDDITTAAYTTQTPKNSTSKTHSIKQRIREVNDSNRKVREKKTDNENDADYITLEEAINTEFSQEESNSLKDVEENVFEERKILVFVRLPIQPEIIAKKYDLKSLSRYADILTIPTHNIVNRDEESLTYHPSRLMGLSDIQNTDSILDFLTGMGGLKSKMVITLPATVLKFQLKDEKKNTPRSPAVSKPEVIDQSQLCELFSKNNWTLERDEDLTAPYAYSGKTWLAFEDEISVDIKGKYVLLRELAGAGIYPIDSDRNDGSCTNRTGSSGYLTRVLRRNFENLGRKPRALVLESLQEEIHDVAFTNTKAGVQVSEYRIIRVVDHSGAVHVIRKNTKTEFECSRQGYFSHPLGCNKFYRCVKFDQYSNEFTVFEYDCPAGLAFDERWEVCVWPGSLPHGAPCTGSSEIAPVPRSHYQCPNHEGYFADPENCRWFFACLDHARDGITPLTAYEFICPFGLVFSEEKLACDWPWLVGSCGNRGAAGYLNIKTAGQSQGIHSATFINGGNLEASFGQYDNLDQRASFIGFGQKFGSVLKESSRYNEQSTYQGAQSGGFGYIASQFNDDHDKTSFAAFPDYEISGGRVFNKEGVVLNQNIAGITSGGFEGVVEGKVNINGGTIGESQNLIGDARYSQPKIDQSNIRTESQIKYQKVEPAVITKEGDILKTAAVSSGGEASLLTPKPFSVHIPSVQINKEYSEHSTVESTTPQNLVAVETPQSTNSENVNIYLKNIQHVTGKQYSTPRGFTVSQPAVSLTLPIATPTAEIHSFEGVIPVGFDATHSKSNVSPSTRTSSSGGVPKAEIQRSEQTNLKQNKFSNKIFVNQPPVISEIPVIKQPFVHSSDVSGAKEAVSLSIPLVTPKPGVHSFEYSTVNHDVDLSQPLVSSQSSFAGYTQQHKISDQSTGRKSLEKSSVSVDILASVPVVQTHSFTTNEGQTLGARNLAVELTDVPLVPVTPSVSTGTESGIRLPAISSGFAQSSIDHKVSNELKLNKPQKTFEIPAIPVVSKAGSEEYSGQFSAHEVSNKVSVVTPKTDFHIFSQAGPNSNEGTGKNNVPAVTPQPDLGLSRYYGPPVTQTAPFHSQGVTSTVKNNFYQTGTAVTLKDFTKVSYDEPASVEQRNADSFKTLNFLQQKEILPETKKFYSIPLETSDLKNFIQTQHVSHGFFKPASGIKFSQVAVPVQSTFGQRSTYSSSFKQSENQFDSLGHFGAVNSTPKSALIDKAQVFSPKIEKSKTLSEVTVEQQPVVSVSTVRSTATGQTFSIPETYSQDFSQSSGFNNINFKSTFVQPQVFTVTTVRPLSTVVTPSTDVINEQPSGHSSVNIVQTPQIINVKHQKKINVETYNPALQETIINLPKEINVNQKFNFKGEAESFAPVAHVTTSIPATFNQDIIAGKSDFYDRTIGYLSPAQQSSHASAIQYGAGVRNKLLDQGTQSEFDVNHHIEFLKSKSLIKEERAEFAPHQQQIQTTTGPPVYQQSLRSPTPANKHFTPREKLLGLEITKSIEVNPSELFQSTEEHFPVKIIEGQQQPLNFVSQKTSPAEQSFYQRHEKLITSTESGNFPESSTYGEHFEIQRQIRNRPKTEFVEQKQYLLPVVTPRLQTDNCNTAKTNNIEEPGIYFEGAAPALPVFEASKIPLTKETETKQFPPPSGFVTNSAKTIFVEKYEKRQPQLISRPSIFQPTPTEMLQYIPSTSEDSTIINHKSFDSKKINTVGTTPLQSAFIRPEIHSTLKPAVSFFLTSGHLSKYNFTAGNGHSAFDSKIKHAVNPNIEIPEPPKEYILAQNGYTAVTPKLSTGSRTTGQFQSTSIDSFINIMKGPSHFPPLALSYGKPSESLLISVGNLNEKEIHNQNVEQFFAQNSGKFYQGNAVDNEKFIKEIIRNQGKGEIEVNKEGSSTVRYEGSSTTPRQRTRGRLYHGDITSGRQATNKYEEYEINGENNRQKSLETEKVDASKTTIDLKNLKLDNSKKTVIVVSQVSDANPVLIGKLAGQCSCQSNMLELRTKGKKSKGSFRRKNKNSSIQQHSAISNEYLPPYEGSQSKIEVEALATRDGAIAAPETVVIDGTKSSREKIFHTNQNVISLPTSAQPDFVSSATLNSLNRDEVLSVTSKPLLTEEKIKSKNKQFRGRARFLPPSSFLSEEGSSAPLLSPIPASEIASTFDYSVVKGDESRTQNEIDGGKRAGKANLRPGAAFDRYGPGGWRGFDETLQGSIDCKRPGLFRHPKHCNKFYACNYDPWKEQFTLHVFNCPIHLTYDSSISACNWPVRGPACADDNLLV